MSLSLKFVLTALILLASILYAIWRQNAQFVGDVHTARKQPVTINRDLGKRFQDWTIPEIPKSPQRAPAKEQ